MWSRDREGAEAGRCRLWLQHSTANPLTVAAEPLHKLRHPPGYVVSPTNPRLAYRGHSSPTPGGYGLIEKCQEDDPDSVPAFPTTEEEIFSIIGLGLVNSWSSINDIREEGEYEDLSQENQIVIRPEWYQHIHSNQ